MENSFDKMQLLTCKFIIKLRNINALKYMIDILQIVNSFKIKKKTVTFLVIPYFEEVQVYMHLNLRLD